MKKSLLDEEFIDLFADDKPATPKANPSQEAAAGLFIPLEQIQPDPQQPRKFSGDDDDDLKLLAESIVQHGILQPITVQPVQNGKTIKYQIIAGERRWRAAQIALQTGSKCQRKGYDLGRIPVYIRNPESDSDKLEMQMVENLARSGMTDTDISRALNKLISTIHVSKAELARRLGRSETWVKNILTRADPDSEVVSKRIGVPVEDIGSNEIARLVSWSKDNEKQVVLDQIAEKLRGGAILSRALISELEERYDLTFRFPQLKKRADLTMDDLQTWKNLWYSDDPAQNAIAQRVLDGMTLAEAMQAPMAAPEHDTDLPPMGDNVRLGDDEDISPDPDPATLGDDDFVGNNDFQIDEKEMEDVVAAKSATLQTPVHAERTNRKSSEEDRRNMDTAGMGTESGGVISVADQTSQPVHVRIPADMVDRLLEKTGLADDLTVDADTVLRAITLLLGQ